MNIALSTEVLTPVEGTKTIIVEATDTGVKISIKHYDDKAINSHNDSTRHIEWDKVEDAEFLAGLFQFEMVCVFEAAVKLMGKVYLLKDAE